ncbi:MAG: 2'-5' RNA ligase family protein [Burkholderiaceae bacterium]
MLEVPEHSVWLLPSEAQLTALRAQVQALAPRHEGHLFEPHVTVQGDLPLAPEPARALVDRLAAASPPLQWPVGAVEGTEHYFRSLYLRLEAGESFERLCRACVQASGTADGLSPYAHLSLAYGPTRGDAHALRARLMRELGGAPLVFDRIALARSGQAVPIDQWALVHVQPLRGTA